MPDLMQQPDTSDATSAGLSGGPPPGAGGNLQPATPSPAPAPASPMQAQQEQHKGILSDILHAVGDVLGGPTTKSVVNQQTGAIEKVPLTRGERIAHGIATGIIGAAAGAAQHGPGAAGKAGLAGAQAEQAIQQQKFQNTQEESRNVQAQNAEQQRALLNQATIAHLTQETASSAWQMQREGTEIDTKTQDKLNAYGQLVASDPRNKDWGTYATFGDFLKAHEGLQQDGVNLAQLQAQGKLVAVPVTEGGKVKGVRVFQVEPQWSEQTNTEPVKLSQPSGMDEKGNVKYQELTVPAGGMKNGDLVKYLGTTAKESLDADQKRNQEQRQMLQTQSQIETAKSEQYKNYQEGKALEGSTQPDAFGDPVTLPPGGVKEANKIHDSFKKDADELAKTEGTYSMFRNVLNDIDAGKEVTGAKSVVALFNAIGLSATPLKGMGMRINNNTVEEHANARSLPESLRAKFLKLKDGDVITPNQIKDYADIATQARHDAFIQKFNQAKAAGIDGSFLLPAGNGHQADPGTIKIFIDAAGGDPQKAHKALVEKGWQ